MQCQSQYNELLTSYYLEVDVKTGPAGDQLKFPQMQLHFKLLSLENSKISGIKKYFIQSGAGSLCAHGLQSQEQLGHLVFNYQKLLLTMIAGRSY